MQYFCDFLGITRLGQKNGQCPVYLIYISYFVFLLYYIFLTHSAVADNYGESLIKRSVEMIGTLKTIECNLRMDVWVDNVEFSSRGRYEEQVAKYSQSDDFFRSMYRLDINFLTDQPLAPGSDPNRMTVVCHLSEDRQKSQIWQYLSIEGKKELNIIRLPALEDAVKRSRTEPKFKSVNEVRNLGGIAAMLRQIDQFYEFTASPRNGKQEGDGGDVWILTGVLRKEQYSRLLEQFGGLGKRKKLPEDFPSDIEIWIGQSDFFPYKIRYFNRPTEDSKKRTPLTQTSYYDVVLNGEEIDSGNFALFNENGEYPDGMINFKDDTEGFILTLGL